MVYEKIKLGKARDLSNQKFGRITPLYRTNNQSNRVAWVCQCDCGKQFIALATNITTNKTKSCGCLNEELKTTRYKDLLGQKFGKLLVIEKLEKRTNNKNIIWKCQCDCGNIIEVSSPNLIQNKTKSCGCLAQDKIIDLSNQRFGKLVALDYIHKNSKIYWNCQCDCGNKTLVLGDSLRRGATRSCGCYHKEMDKSYVHFIDLSNQKFGRLLALFPINRGENNNQGLIWKCKCDCGNECEVAGYSLRKGYTQSCGCLLSKGEEKIGQILSKNNIFFTKQKTFEGCIYPETKAKLRFDFYVDNKYLIEFDGKQHYSYSKSPNGGWNTKQNYLEIIRRDKYKNNWCKEHNIPLIRIPYFLYDQLDLKDLLLETSEFII